MKSFECDVLGAQFFDEVGGLLERHIAIVRFYNDAGKAVVPSFAASSGNDDAMLLPAANRSEITAHLDIPSC